MKRYREFPEKDDFAEKASDKAKRSRILARILWGKKIRLAHLVNNTLVCDGCNLPMRARTKREVWPNYGKGGDEIETTMTLVGYSSPPGHNHDDNCVVRTYACNRCSLSMKISVRRRCPTCDWVGKESCGCHSGPKLDSWPEVRTPHCPGDGQP